MTTVAKPETWPALIVNVFDRDPDGIVTVAGTVSSALLLDRLITAPSGGAAPFKVTVPVMESPLFTVERSEVMLASVAGMTESVTDCELLL